MASTRWIPVCQWCGKQGSITNSANEFPPRSTPRIQGKCPSHPSGDKNANHAPQWEKR